VADSAGYFAVADNSKKFYEDVQCESCHGPGATHITAPDESQPLSTIVAGVGATKGCATCHNGTHQPFVEEWARSPHDTVFAPPTGVRASTGDGPYCRGCHTGQGAIARFDPRARYQEMNAGIPGVTGSWQPITCVVCHDPHGTDNPANLRFPVNTPDLSTNLCMQCHNRRANPDMTSESSGPHTPQGPMLLGEAGWVPPGLSVLGVSSHGTDANPNLCAGCHVNAYRVNNADGSFLMNATGHTFEPIPCADANGYPDSTVTDCAPAERTFRACTNSGCHGTQDAARNAWLTSTARLDALVRTLWVDADHDNALDAFPADSGLMARVKLTSPLEFKNADGILTVAEGAFFNARMPSADRSGGAHNPFYEEALLIATVQALRAQYTYLPPAPPAERAREEERMRVLRATWR
jgi:predicted CXXCH cytochrome family protein